MKFLQLTLAAAAAAAVLSTAAFLPRPTGSAQQPESALVVADLSADLSADPDEATELAKLMKAINKSMRSLRSALKDPDRAAEACELVEGVQQRALAAKGMKPAMLADIPQDEQATFLLDYRKEMHRWLGQLFELEIAVLEGRTEDAQGLHKAMLKAKGPAHKKFQKEDDDH